MKSYAEHVEWHERSTASSASYQQGKAAFFLISSSQSLEACRVIVGGLCRWPFTCHQVQQSLVIYSVNHCWLLYQLQQHFHSSFRISHPSNCHFINNMATGRLRGLCYNDGHSARESEQWCRHSAAHNSSLSLVYVFCPLWWHLILQLQKPAKFNEFSAYH